MEMATSNLRNVTTKCDSKMHVHSLRFQYCWVLRHDMVLGAHKECLQLKQHATNRLGSFRFDKRSYPLVLAASVRNVKKSDDNT